ncbi:hypothetical protein SK128_015528 [Halocaridina rubra]|uniref:Uncharacterized protein n=1 Tax=Halocaridina rubra TaxID=373956 RepID=A0AAN8ZSV2_HALRR
MTVKSWRSSSGKDDEVSEELSEVRRKQTGYLSDTEIIELSYDAEHENEANEGDNEEEEDEKL